MPACTFLSAACKGIFLTVGIILPICSGFLLRVDHSGVASFLVLLVPFCPNLLLKKILPKPRVLIANRQLLNWQSVSSTNRSGHSENTKTRNFLNLFPNVCFCRHKTCSSFRPTHYLYSCLRWYTECFCWQGSQTGRSCLSPGLLSSNYELFFLWQID